MYATTPVPIITNAFLAEKHTHTGVKDDVKYMLSASDNDMAKWLKPN